MGIITISRGSYSRGNEIAKLLAQKLGYECISREILLKASKDFDIPEVKLISAIKNAPTFFNRFNQEKQRYVKFIRHAFLEHVQKDNVVYHGLAGQFFTKDIPNVLKVRITANIDFRIKRVMKNENVTEDEARNLLQQIDSKRRKWSMALYGIDTKAAELYDIVLHIDCVQVEGAVEILSDLAKRPCFQSTPESKNKLQELLEQSNL